MSLGAFTDQELARGFVKHESREDFDAADRYQDEFWRRRRYSFGDPNDSDDTLAVWLALCEAARNENPPASNDRG